MPQLFGQPGKEVWTEADFEGMGWHDGHIHAISFPNEDLIVSFDDYLFEWVLNDESLYKFWVSPCIIYFANVSNFKINIDFENSSGLDILNITRNNPRLSPNGKAIYKSGI